MTADGQRSQCPISPARLLLLEDDRLFSVLFAYPMVLISRIGEPLEFRGDIMEIPDEMNVLNLLTMICRGNGIFDSDLKDGRPG